MKKFAMIFAAAAGLLLSACVEEKLVEPQEPRPDILGEPVTITVGVPEKTPSTKVTLGGEKGLEMTWDEGDQLYALAFDAQNQYLGLSEFTIQSDCAGAKSARFDGMTVNGADHYVVYYKASGLNVSKDGKTSMNYDNMTSDGRNSSLPLKECLYLQSEPVSSTDLKTATFALKALNSVLCLEFQGYPSNLGELNAVDWAIVDRNGNERKVMRLHYTGKTTLLGARPALNGLYLCFNPEEIKLEAGEQFRFRLNGTAGRNFSFLSAPKAGIVFGVGKRYSALVKAYNEPFADLLDIVFDDDKSARDLSPWGRGINTDKGMAISLVHPEGYAANAVTFNHKFAGAPAGGVYTIPDYDMRDVMADGFSIEAYIMSDDPNRTNAESKAFSSTKSGGFALELNKKRLNFIYKPSNAAWRFLDSGIEAKLGQWYHVVGIFDPTNGSSLYVDGKRVVEPCYVGDKLTFSTLNEASYLTVGANSSYGTSSAPKLQGAWHGGVAQPRLYSRPLSESEVQALFKQLGHVNPSPVAPQHNAPEADLLDIVFNEDGSATDISPMGMIVEHAAGPTHVNYYNELYKRQVARFTHASGSLPTSGYYKINYQLTGNVNSKEKCQQFIDKLKDGHSIEVLFSTSANLDGTNEVKMFSSTESGGVGFLTKNGELTYLPNISTTGASNWIWAKSGVKVQPDRYIHAVGVWDQTAQTARIYVDGQKKGEVTAAGDLVMAAVGSQWFGIGVDPSGSKGQTPWCGDVVLARIYDDPLTDLQVSALYEQIEVPNPVSPNTIKLSDVRYLSSCRIAPGYKYHIYAQGFTKDDTLCLDPLANGEKTIWPETVFNANTGELIVSIPSSFKSGKYRLKLERGTQEYLIGITQFIVDNNVTIGNQTKVVAHRCYQKNYKPNSLEAFVDSENRNIWGAEIDVHITKDKKVLVDHDGRVGKWENNDRFSNYNSYSPALLGKPKFKTFLEAMVDPKKCPSLNMVLEIKDQLTDELDYQLVDECLALIQNYPQLKKRICWIAFDKKVCDYILSKTKVDPDWQDCLVMYLGGNLTPQQCLDAGIRGIDYSAARLATHNQWISEAHDLNMVVNVWTVNNQTDMIDFITKGVDFITTDEPDLLNEMLNLQFVTK